MRAFSGLQKQKSPPGGGLCWSYGQVVKAFRPWAEFGYYLTSKGNPINQIRGNTMRFFAFSLLLLASSWAQAACYGSGNFKSCYDNSGNSYTVQKFGNQTVTSGYNNSTGSSWSQNSSTYGNTTYQNGTSSTGGSWNQTIQNFGNGNTYRYGSDSQGNSFSQSCNSFGCY